MSQIARAERLRKLMLAKPHGGRRAVTYVSDRAIGRPQPGATRAVLVVHGIDRDGDRYWRALARAARRAGPEIRAGTYLLAPQFFTRRDVRARGLARSTLAWKGQAWKEGYPARSDDWVSSFEALDALLARLADRSGFPELQTIVLVGHSAGGQLVQRYAAASEAGDALLRLGIAMRYVVINPSSYLYLDASRPGLGHDGGFAPPATALLKACPEYNAYKYGLERPNPYLARRSTEEVKARYGRREVVYLLGEADDDPNDENLDRSCAAMMQGRTRFERGSAFLQHLANVYGDEIRTRHVLDIVPDLGHQGTRILRSPSGLRWLFDVIPSTTGRRLAVGEP